MKKRAVLIFFIVLTAVGFYAGKTLLPGFFGYGADAAPSGKGPTGSVPTTAAPPADTKATGEKTGDAGADTANSGYPKVSPDSKNSFWIDVDISEQQVIIMQGDEIVKTMTASTGVEGKETPLGTFQIQNRGDWFFSEKYQQGAKYWVSFKDWGIYLFHSLAMDKDQNVIPEEAEKLGKPASHGCVRLAIDDAKWIYDNIPERAKVVIHE